ncbi:MAG: crossover junction endodeoxyribonuclease RuvC [Opitutaceae bacterium]|jgi:crossover junction endodeoxyribonuclease RuvC|nr:crossover junction endodeoxyribonuclease RuvC [Opitutaceae bacterium]
MASKNVRQLWAAKLAGGGNAARKPGALSGLPVGTLVPASALRGTGSASPAPHPLAGTQRVSFSGQVLGIDPSLRGTGLALIEFTPGRDPILLRCRTVTVSPKKSMAFALGEISTAVTAFLADFQVRHVALEQTIYVQNFQTAQILGAARGAAIAAAAVHGHDEVWEYAPLRVKQAVVGAGRASKEQMARTVMALLGHGRMLASDEADAAGVALCHAFTWRGPAVV